MLKIENIVVIKRVENRIHVIFNDGDKIKLRFKSEILPLLLLLRYGTCNKYDFFGEKYVYIKDLLFKKSIPEAFDRNYRVLDEGFKHLIYDDGFKFIRREYRDRFVNYTLEIEDHYLLLKEQVFSFYKLDRDVLNEIYEKQERKCNMCKCYIDKNLAIVDYIIPLLRGGKELKRNTQILCAECYEKKRNACKSCIDECSTKKCPLLANDEEDLLINEDDLILIK